MNILFISNDPAIGIEGSAVRLRMRAYADVVAQSGGTLHILSRAAKTEVVEDGALIFHGMKVGKLRAMMSFPRLARSIILDNNISVVSTQDPFEYGWIGMKAIKGTETKLHVQIHTDFLSPWFIRSGIYRSIKVRMPMLNRFRQYLARDVLPKAQGIRVVSERINESLKITYGNLIVNASVIPIAVSETLPAAVVLPAHPFTFALIAVGRLEPEKRVEDIILAIVRLKDAYPALGVLIVGEGRERTKLEKLARKYGVSERVVFLGASASARALMPGAQAFIQASAYEGYGLTLIEAALARIPIVTTDVGIVGEVFKGYEHVLAAPVGDPTNLAAHIAWLIEDHTARLQLAQAAETRAKEHLAATDSSPSAVIQDIMRLI